MTYEEVHTYTRIMQAMHCPSLANAFPVNYSPLTLTCHGTNTRYTNTMMQFNLNQYGAFINDSQLTLDHTHTHTHSLFGGEGLRFSTRCQYS